VRKSILFATIVFFGAAAPAAAQTFGFGAHAGVSIPTGDYAGTDDITSDGFAELGFSGGLDLWYPLTSFAPGLSWYTSADAIAHSVDDSEFIEEVDGGYLYFPLMTGLRFDIPLGTVGVFATGQVGAIFARPPSDDVVDGEFSTELGFSFGGGVQVTDNVYAGLKYYPLGDVDFSYEGMDEPFEQSVSFLDIYLGFGVH
jgi:opacity protein-like surface antigen